MWTSTHYRKPALAVICAGLAWSASAVSASANGMSPDDPFHGLPALAQKEMSGMRGGMMVGNIPVDFAVVLQTTAQGATQKPETLTTTLAINNAGGVGSASTVASGGTLLHLSNGGMGLTTGNATGIIEQIIGNQIGTIIHNTANGMVITHSTTLNVTLPNFLKASQNYNALFEASRLGTAAGLAAIGH